MLMFNAGGIYRASKKKCVCRDHPLARLLLFTDPLPMELCGSNLTLVNRNEGGVTQISKAARGEWGEPAGKDG